VSCRSLKERQHLRGIVLSVFLVLSVTLTWPLSVRLWDSLPGDLGDPLFNTWILAWNAHATQHRVHRFDANIFHPHRNTLAYSEHLTGIALFTTPVILLTRNPVFAYNLAFLASFVLAGYGMFLLVHRLSGSYIAGIAAGIVYAFAPYRFVDFGQLQVYTIQWFPFMVLYLYRMLVERRPFLAVPAAVFFALQALSCGYYLLYVSLVAGGCFVFAAMHTGHRTDRRVWAGWLLFAVVAMAVVMPFQLPYYTLNGVLDIRRDINTVIALSADALHYVSVSARQWLAGRLMGMGIRRTDAFSTALFPGLMAVVVVIWWWAGRLRSRGIYRTPRWVQAALWCALAGAVLSLGPVVRVGGREILPGPYALLYQYVPGFDAARFAGRIAVIWMFGFSALVGSAVASLGSVRRAVAICAVLLIEYVAVPIPVARVPVGREGFASVYRWLAARQDIRVIVELPMGITDVPRQTRTDIPYLWNSTLHWKRLLNGYSGYYPWESEWLRDEIMEHFPSVRSVEILGELGVDAVVLHRSGFDGAQWERVRQEMMLRTDSLSLVYDDAAAEVWMVRISSDARRRHPVVAQFLDSGESERRRLVGVHTRELTPLLRLDGSSITFARKESYDSIHKVAGWSRNEPWGCWVLGTDALAAFSTDQRWRGVTLTVVPAPMVRGMRQALEVFFNDRLLGRHEFDGDGETELTFDVPPDAWTGGVERLDFRMDRAVRAGGRDHRMISLGVKSIRFSEGSNEMHMRRSTP